jgi:hypothetical protein
MSWFAPQLAIGVGAPESFPPRSIPALKTRSRNDRKQRNDSQTRQLDQIKAIPQPQPSKFEQIMLLELLLPDPHMGLGCSYLELSGIGLAVPFEESFVPDLLRLYPLRSHC